MQKELPSAFFIRAIAVLIWLVLLVPTSSKSVRRSRLCFSHSCVLSTLTIASVNITFESDE